jgi:hypothetical protein
MQRRNRGFAGSAIASVDCEDALLIVPTTNAAVSSDKIVECFIQGPLSV